MLITIISKKFGTQKLDTENPKTGSSTTIFQIVEHMFNEWFDHNTQPGAPMGKDIQGMYYGECDQPAIYSKKGAVQDGIDNIIEYCLETGKQVISTKDIVTMDVECAFQV